MTALNTRSRLTDTCRERGNAKLTKGQLADQLTKAEAELESARELLAAIAAAADVGPEGTRY